MANTKLFNKTTPSVKTTVNNAGGLAYCKDAKNSLAQFACTGTFNGTFYCDASTILSQLKDIVKKCDDRFIAQVAVYSRNSSFMKDMPAYLVAVLAARGSDYFSSTFQKVIDNGKMLRNFVQIGRSGEAGKVINMSASRVRKAINKWFESRSSEVIFRNSIGNNPSMKDILRMARPKPENDEKSALYAYLRDSKLINNVFVTLNKNGGIMYANAWDNLPEIVKQYENFKKNRTGEIPEVDFRMLDSILTKDQMREVWEKQTNAGWHMLRMNLNNFEKYGVLQSATTLKRVVSRLKDAQEIKKSKVFPYQIMNTYINTDVNSEIKLALQDALDISLENVPKFNGNGFVCVDTSGSMNSSVTGNSATPSKVTCVQVAGLFASSILRHNPNTQVIPFDTRVHLVSLNPRDSVMTNAQKLNRGGGGTDCACALRHINQNNGRGDYVVFISDNESWSGSGYYRNQGNTGLMQEWKIFKSRNPHAKLICIDITPGSTSQSKPEKDVLQVAGYSDNVMTVISSFLDNSSVNFWIKEIESVNLV